MKYSSYCEVCKKRRGNNKIDHRPCRPFLPPPNKPRRYKPLTEGCIDAILKFAGEYK